MIAGTAAPTGSGSVRLGSRVGVITATNKTNSVDELHTVIDQLTGPDRHPR
jgi:hypothetical protein